MFQRFAFTARHAATASGAFAAAAALAVGLVGSQGADSSVAHAASAETAPAASSAAATATTATATTSTTGAKPSERVLVLRRALAPVRQQEEEILARWERDEEENWRFLPPRAWPAYQPKVKEIPRITSVLRENECLTEQVVHSPDECISVCKSKQCAQASFDLASALVFNDLDSARGLRIFQRLAARGDVDGMVATGIVLVEGLGVSPRPAEGVRWLRKACELNSPQACYEMGSAYYNGVGAGGGGGAGEAEVVVPEDDAEAFWFFQKASEQGHAGGRFMTGDCLLNGVGTEADPGRAVPLLYAAAEQGHRFARQQIRELLDEVRE